MLTTVFLSIIVGTVLAVIGKQAQSNSKVRAMFSESTAVIMAFHRAAGDAQRQIAALRAGRVILIVSVKMLIVLAVVAIIIWLPVLFMHWSEKLQAIYVVLTSFVAISCWYIIKEKSADPIDGTYRLLDRWLHWIALEPVVVRHLTFDLEKFFFLPRPSSLSLAQTAKQFSNPSDGAVYVCGLARSGTTMLLRTLVVRSIKTNTHHAIPMSNLFHRNTTGSWFISSMPARMRALSSSSDATRIWRRNVRAIFENAHSMRFSQEPCLGV